LTVRRTLLSGLLLAAGSSAQAQSPTPPGIALWCVPTLYRQAINIAQACGRPVAVEALARIGRMSDAYYAALDRSRSAEAARSMRQQLERMASADAARRPGFCAAQLPQIEPILRGLEANGGEEMTRRFEAEAAASRDPLTGGCL
jgi:hypothetical protein